MPNKPTAMTLNASAIDILNTIRANAPYDYQSRVPEATQANLAQVGQSILQFQSTTNEFLSALVNRIGYVMITSKSYKNPLRQFKKRRFGLRGKRGRHLCPDCKGSSI